MLEIPFRLVDLSTAGLALFGIMRRREERAARVEARRREDVDRVNAWLRTQPGSVTTPRNRGQT